MKKIFGVLTLVIMMFAFVLTGCSTGLQLPSANAEVVGNGSFVVQKGDYLYFANAYTEYSAIDDTVNNDKNTQDEYSLYRVKTTNGAISYDEDGYPQNLEKIVSKVSGFENSGLFIVGDYLFFASPNMHKTSANEDRFDLVSIFSIKLDGSEYRELYTTEDYTDGSFTIANINGVDYLVIIEGSTITRSQISGGTLTNRTVLAEDVTSAMFADEFTTSFDENIYFTTERSQADQDLGLTGNLLKKVNIETGEVFGYSTPVGETITLINLQNSKLFYSKETTNETNIFVKSAEGQDVRLSYYTDAEKVYFLGYDNNNDAKPVVYKTQSKLVMQNIGEYSQEVLLDADVEILFTDGDYVYYKTDSEINRISYKDKQAQLVLSIELEEIQFDFDGRYLYVYNTLDGAETQTKYLNRVDTYTIGTTSTQTLKIVAFVLDEDKPSDEE